MSLPKKNVWPETLRKRDQWVWWRIVDGVKIPYQTSALGETASSTDPNTWSCFYDAYHYFNEDTTVALGFVLTAEDPLVVFDLDHVVNEDGEVATWAEKLIDQCDSLTYRSISGTGFHIWLRCSNPLPGPGLSTRWPGLPSTALEIFEQKRGLVMSGDVYRKTGIKDRTDQILRLYKKIASHKAALAAAKAPPPSRRSGKPTGGGITLRDWLDKHGVDYRTGHTTAADDGVSYKIECPLGSEHTDEKNGIGHAAVFVKSGKWAASCCHTHTISWKDFRENISSKPAYNPGQNDSKITWGRKR